MRVVITGGTGLIGTALTARLLEHDHDVVILTRDPSKVSTTPVEVIVAEWDGMTADGWSELISDAAIVNLAGANLAEGRWTPERKRVIRESRLNAGKAVVDAVKEVSPKPTVLVQASAVGYYGSRGDEELREASDPGNDFLATVCADWEESTAEVTEMGVRRVVIRTSPVLDKRSGFLPRMIKLYRYFLGGTLGSGSQWFPFIHIEDEVSAIMNLLEDETLEGAFNLSSPMPITNKEFSKALGKALGRPSFAQAPRLMLRLLLGEVTDALLASQKVLPQRLLDAGFGFEYADIDSALRDVLS